MSDAAHDACCGGGCAPGASPSFTPSAVSAPPAAATFWQSGSVTVITGGVLILGGAGADWAGQAAVATALFSAAILVAIPTPARRAARSLRAGVLDINVLMVLAVAGAVILGEWFEAAAVVWLFGIAQWLEGWSMSRARRAIRELMTLTPQVATRRSADGDADVPVDTLRVGELVLVRPGGRVPIDGRVRRGQSTVDQSPVTGESWPVDKGPDDEVFAGTINGDGALDVEVTRPAADSTLARIVALVEQAQADRAPIQRWVDRFARRYTPAVVALAVLVAAIPPMAFGGDWATWVYRALALLVVACPCALVISTPVSIVSAITAAARRGVLIKGGAHLERLGAITCVAFDKTGTLTAGHVSVSELMVVDGVSRHGVLAAAAGLEQDSEHPIGRAIVAYARAERVEVPTGAGFRALPGLGAEALIGGVAVLVGSHRLFEERRLCSPSLHAHVGRVEEQGRSAVLVGIDGSGVGVLGMVDEARTTGRSAVDDLRALGIRHVALLTGDRTAVARQLHEQVGVDAAFGDLLPQDKVAHVKRLRDQFGPVVMVGDGINDAPALAAADVGIAMGVSGTDVAIETADVALLTNDLASVPYAVGLGRAAVSNIRTNVTIALGLKLAFVVVAASGFATLWMAVLADTGASLLVTANSLRLLRRR